MHVLNASTIISAMFAGTSPRRTTNGLDMRMYQTTSSRAYEVPIAAVPPVGYPTMDHQFSNATAIGIAEEEMHAWKKTKSMTRFYALAGSVLLWSVMAAGSQGASATTLSDAAAACAVRTFCQVTMPGLTTALLDSTGGQTITSFASKAAWNAQTRTFYFLGQGHLTCPKLVSYSDTSNSWTSLSAPFGCGGFYHSYQHNTINPILNKLYIRHYGASYMDRYDIATSTWSQTASSTSVGIQCCGAAEWFPEMGLVIHVGVENGSFGAIWGYNEGSNTWTRVGAANTYTMGSYDNAAVYSPIHHVIVFGGGNGSTSLWKLSASGTVTAVTPPPVGINEASPGGTIFTVDPASGNFLLINASGAVRELSFTSDPAGSWTTISGTTAPFVNASPGNGVYGVVATPISNYGVVGFLVCGGVSGCSGNSSPTFYIYKHGVGGGAGSPPPGGDTSAPSPPGSPSASAVSSSQINLSWSASTDNVGVSGYKVFRNGTQVGTPTGTAYQDTGLSASTTYAYTIQAYDAAGNTSSQSSGASATTQSAPAPGGTDFQSKCQGSGVIGCFGVDTTNQLFYNWPSGTVCDSALSSHPNGNNPFGLSRSGNGNAVAHVERNGQCVFPIIDSTVKHSGTGSLKFTIAGNTGADSSGYYSEPFKRLGSGQFSYVGPGSPLGNVLYFQFYQMFDSNFLNTDFLCLNGGCGGWKQMIWYGNPPFGSSSSSIEVTHNNGWQRGVPQMYGQQGHDDYGVQDVAGCLYAGSGFASRSSYPEPPCVRYKANQWMEFTGRIEILGTSNSPSSRVQLWVDGKQVIDYRQAKICWGGTCGDGDGIGSFLASPYHTNKDSSQNHSTGFTWMDDIIVSTQPIPMTNSSVPNPPPAAPVNLRVQ